MHTVCAEKLLNYKNKIKAPPGDNFDANVIHNEILSGRSCIQSALKSC